jgi:hypothetical protein
MLPKLAHALGFSEAQADDPNLFTGPFASVLDFDIIKSLKLQR